MTAAVAPTAAPLDGTPSAVPNASPDASPGMPPDASAGPMALAVAALRRAAADRAGRVDLLVLHVGDERFAVPLAASVEVVRLDGSTGVGRLRGIDIIHAGSRFGVATPEGPRAAAIVRAGDGLLALAVDAAVPVHGADLSGVRPVPWPDDGVLLGVLPRGDTVVALVDVDALATPAAPASVPRSATPLHPARA